MTAAQDPSRGYRLLPAPPVCGPRQLTVTIRRPHGAVNATIMMWSDDSKILAQPRTHSYEAELAAKVEDIAGLAAQLLSRWQEFVEYQPVGREHRPLEVAPHTNLTDLSRRPRAELLAQVTDLARAGAHLLKQLLAGSDPELVRLRRHLLGVLERQDLRIRFDSDLDIPWPMLALDTGRALTGGRLTADPFSLFLGWRHQIETAKKSYLTDYWYVSQRTEPVSSLNADEDLMSVAGAAEVQALLDERTDLTERWFRSDLLEDLALQDLDEDIMYFFCHGQYTAQGDRTWLSLSLSDAPKFNATMLDQYRAPHTEANAEDAEVIFFHPLVLLNVCFAGAPATVGFADLAGTFIKHGALGVLAPQIAMPRVVGAEFALQFLTRYICGGKTAGAALLKTVRWFTKNYRNPLPLAYSLFCGLDSRLAPVARKGADAR
ncbi:hypothetical protein [Streptomyces sp. enrichment culture]|uniref:hypothetical protein n=1 Tax=Streptomyces sp. enrichment culture TaxID=1795815 RepID=UPI003F56FA6B